MTFRNGLTRWIRAVVLLAALVLAGWMFDVSEGSTADY